MSFTNMELLVLLVLVIFVFDNIKKYYQKQKIERALNMGLNMFNVILSARNLKNSEIAKFDNSAIKHKVDQLSKTAKSDNSAVKHKVDQLSNQLYKLKSLIRDFSTQVKEDAPEDL